MHFKLTALFAIFILCAPLAAQETPDVVLLRNGNHLSGAITLDENDKEGFTLKRWDTGAVIYVKWTQLPEIERNRLLSKPVEASSSKGAFLDGIRVITETREVIGILVEEKETQLLVKTAKSTAPVVIPIKAIYTREEVKIRESDAYSAEEMVDKRAEGIEENDVNALMSIAGFAADLGLYDRAKGYYQQAAGIAEDEGTKEEINAFVAKIDALVIEAKAVELLAEVNALAERTEYEQAIEKAKSLLSEYKDSEVAKKNAELVTTLEQEAQTFAERRFDILVKKIPEAFKILRGAQFSKYSRSKYSLQDARQQVGQIDETVVTGLAEKFKSTPDEIRRAWEQRPEPPRYRRVSFGSGTWIVKGGQDGGVDTKEQYQPPTPKQKVFDNNLRNRNTRRRQQQPKPIPLGRELQKSVDWWATASSSQRKAFLECEYAMGSSMVKKVKEETRECRNCRGTGTLKSVRYGKELDVICPICHGVKEEITIYYW